MVTLVAWFSFCFFRLAHLALQNVNKDYVIFSYFRNSIAKSDQKQKTKNGMRFDCSVHTNGKLGFHFWDLVGTSLLCCLSADKHAWRQKKCNENCFIYEIFCQLCANILQSKGGRERKMLLSNFRWHDDKKPVQFSWLSPNWHELWKQEKCLSLAPPRGIFYKTLN